MNDTLLKAPVSNMRIPSKRRNHAQFMFATGIENSYPVITGRDGRNHRVDQLAKCGFYNYWKTDFSLVKELGLEYLRFGPAYYDMHQAPGRYDWDFSDDAFAELQRLEITPLADLCHFGVPDWVGDFQNPDWPELFAQYAGAFAKRYPWIRFYTPINEIFVCATFSAQYGWWNERLASDQAFVTALKHMCRATIRAEEEILKLQPDAQFVQSETTTYFHPRNPQAEDRAEFFNDKRFLSFDLCYGFPVRSGMYEYLIDNGVSRHEYHWFLQHGKELRPHCVMGNDYYETNEHIVEPGSGPITMSGEIFGYYVITEQYYDRYRLPVMHTETNYSNIENSPKWLWKEWANMIRLRKDGVPIIGFTWYSLTDQMDWDTALREDNHHVDTLGLYDLNRNIRPVGVAYKELVAEWRDILPLETFSLSANTK